MFSSTGALSPVTVADGRQQSKPGWSVSGQVSDFASGSNTIDGNDLAGAKTALKATISLIDKMASKGIIHRNAAGRYKSRLTTRIAAGS